MDANAEMSLLLTQLHFSFLLTQKWMTFASYIEYANITQKTLNKHLASDLIKILVDSGFDSDSSISQLNSECIIDNENYINSNKNILIDTEHNNFVLEEKVFKNRKCH